MFIKFIYIIIILKITYNKYFLVVSYTNISIELKYLCEVSTLYEADLYCDIDIYRQINYYFQKKL